MHGLTKWVSGLMRNEQPKTPRLNTVIQMYQRLATSDPDTVKKNVRVFKLFIQENGNVCCHEVTRLMVTRFQASLKETGKAVATVRSYCGSLSSVFGWATDNIEGFRKNPCKGVKLPRLPKRNPTVWTADDMACLHAAVDRLKWQDAVRPLQWHAMFYLAEDCGFRINEILTFRWCDLELHLENTDEKRSVGHVKHRECVDGKWWTWSPKGRRDRQFPLSLRCVAILARLQVACPWTFPLLPRKRCEYLQANASSLPSGVRKRPRNNLYVEWKRIKAAAGVEGGGAFHRMRRTAARRYALLLSERDLLGGFGWTTSAIADVYTGLFDGSTESIAKAQDLVIAGGET